MQVFYQCNTMCKSSLHKWRVDRESSGERQESISALSATIQDECSVLTADWGCYDWLVLTASEAEVSMGNCNSAIFPNTHSSTRS